jgi:hypothetical protein
MITMRSGGSPKGSVALAALRAMAMNMLLTRGFGSDANPASRVAHVLWSRPCAYRS